MKTQAQHKRSMIFVVNDHYELISITALHFSKEDMATNSVDISSYAGCSLINGLATYPSSNC